MRRTEKENWIISIRDCADRIDEGTVAFILGKYGARCIEDLRPWQYSEVFNELDAVEADLK